VPKESNKHTSDDGPSSGSARPYHILHSQWMQGSQPLNIRCHLPWRSSGCSRIWQSTRFVVRYIWPVLGQVRVYIQVESSTRCTPVSWHEPSSIKEVRTYVDQGILSLVNKRTQLSFCSQSTSAFSRCTLFERGRCRACSKLPHVAEVEEIQ